MKKYKFGVIGSFVMNKATFSGQAVKTRNFAEALEGKFGENSIYKVDTHGWKRHPFSLVVKILSAINNCEQIALLPADRGVFVIPKITLMLRAWRKTKIHYIGVGGWLPEFVKTNKRLDRTMRKMYGIYMETNTLKDALEIQGYTNVTVLPNFKKLTILKAEELVLPTDEPLRICTFSRVMKEKGIEDIVIAVKSVNEKIGKKAFHLDIYGKVDSGQAEWFENLKNTFSSEISYKGAIPPENSVDVLKKYFALVFPTQYATEGIPGTIIDAYTAGVPVISSKWDSFSDVVDENRTGIGYTLGKVDELMSLLEGAYHNPGSLNCLKENCLQKAKYYDSEYAINILLSYRGK